MGRSRFTARLAAIVAIVLGGSSLLMACSDDDDPTWDEWEAAHVETLEVDAASVAAIGDGIEVRGRVADVDGLSAAIAEVCGYANETGERVRVNIRVGGGGRLAGGCGEPRRTAWAGWFSALAAIEHVNRVTMIGGVADVRVGGDQEVVGVVTDALAAVADDPPSLLFVDSAHVSVRWTPDEGDLADELELLDRLLDAAGDDLDEVVLSDRRVNATIEGDDELLEQLRLQLGADDDELELSPSAD